MKTLADLRPYQLDAVDWLTDRPAALLGDEMGLGKSAELIFAASCSDRKRIVIVAPAVVCHHWVNECHTWMPSWGVTRLIGGKQPIAKLLNETMLWEQTLCVVLNYDVLKSYSLVLSMWADLIIFDESHYLKNRDSLRTKLAKEMADEVRKRNGWIWLASGTPMPNRPFELVEQLTILDKLEWLGGWQHYVTKYCDGKKEWITVHGGKRRNVWRTDGSSNLDQLKNALDPIMYRRMRRDVMPEITVMPPIVVELDTDSKILADYERASVSIGDYMFERAMQLAIKSGDDDPLSAATTAALKAEAGEHLVVLSQLRRLIAEAKLPAMTDWIKQYQEGGVGQGRSRKLVFFAHHRHILDELYSQFGGSLLIGGMKDADRTKQIEQFRFDKECQIIFASTPAAGIGINLTPASDVAFGEFEWTSAAHRQAIDRCARHGQRNPISVTYLSAGGTVDSTMAQHLVDKMAVVDAVFGSPEDVAAVLCSELARLGAKRAN